MSGDDKDGNYCTICGGIPPEKISVRQILVDGRPTGIDHLDWIVAEVKKLDLADDAAVTEELLKRTKVYNYVPTKKAAKYGEALLEAYRDGGS